MKKRLIEYDLPLADMLEAPARDTRHGHSSTLLGEGIALDIGNLVEVAVVADKV